MRIAHIPRRFVREAWGGTETVVLELARRQIAGGDEASILTSMALAGSDRESIDSVEVRRFPHFYPYWGLSAEDRARMDRKGGNLVSFGLFRELLALPDPGIFHLHTGKRLGALVRTAARMRGIPYVIQLHGGLVSAPESERKDLAEASKKAFEWGKVIGLAFGGRRVVEDADAILCVDRFEAEKLRTLMPGKRVEFTPNGVDPGRFSAPKEAGIEFRKKRGIPHDARIILTVGRIDPQKNQALAIEALPRIRARLPDAVLALAGPATNPDYLRSLKDQAATLGLSNAVFFLGQLDYGNGELAAAYAAADCFLLPSVHEPFGVVALEAWAAGLPLAASEVGGIPAFVRSGENGILFPSGDVEAATNAVLRLLCEPGFAADLARQGRGDMEANYTWAAVSARVSDIYQEAIAAKQAGQRGSRGGSR
ncbi:MAG: glycosyltransferase family 4 protein [Spirochaetota bacterium]